MALCSARTVTRLLKLARTERSTFATQFQIRRSTCFPDTRDRFEDIAVSSGDNPKIASAGEDMTVRIWDAAAGREIVVLRGHTDVVLSVAFAPDGSILVSGGKDGTARVWDPVSGREIATLRNAGLEDFFPPSL